MQLNNSCTNVSLIDFFLSIGEKRHHLFPFLVPPKQITSGLQVMSANPSVNGNSATVRVLSLKTKTQIVLSRGKLLNGSMPVPNSDYNFIIVLRVCGCIYRAFTSLGIMFWPATQLVLLVLFSFIPYFLLYVLNFVIVLSFHISDTCMIDYQREMW